MPIATRPYLVNFATGFARGPAESAYPELWKELKGFWAPQVGITGTTLWDYGPGKHHASPLSGSTPVWIPGPNGYVLEVNEDSWTVADSTDNPGRLGTHDFAVYACGKSTSNLPAGAALFAKDDPNTTSPVGEEAWSLQRSGSGNPMQFIVNGGAALGNGSPSIKNDGIYHSHVACRHGDAGRIYLDGQLGDTAASYFSGLSLDNDLVLQFAARTGVRTVGEWVGEVGPFGIWHRTLTPNEILLLYRDPLAPLRRRKRAHIGFVAAAGGPSTYEESITIAESAGYSLSQIATAENALSFGASSGLTDADLGALGNASTYGASAGLTAATIAIAENALTIAATSGLTDADLGTLGNATSYGASAGLTAAAVAIVDNALTAAATVDLSLADGLDIDDAFAVGLTLNLITAGSISKEEVLALAASAGLTNAAQLVAADAATMAVAASVSNLTDAALGGAISAGASVDVAHAAAGVLQNALTAAVAAALSAAGSVVSVGADHAIVQFINEAMTTPGLLSEAMTKPTLNAEAMTKPTLTDETLLN